MIKFNRFGAKISSSQNSLANTAQRKMTAGKEFEVKNKVFLVTGAAAGIGAVVAKAVLEQGAKHVAILDILVPNGVALEKDLNSFHGKSKAKFYKCDVTNDQELFTAFDETVKEFGSIDVVINNAGIWNDGEEIYKKEIAINFTATVTSTLKAIKIMRKDTGGPGGAVINVSSVAALTQFPSSPIYFATKSAVLQFSNCIGMEQNYKTTGVRVLTVCFSATDTALLHVTAGVDEISRDRTADALNKMKKQRPESAADCVVAAYRRGVSGSTWFSGSDLPPLEITDNVKNAYRYLGADIAPEGMEL